LFHDDIYVCDEPLVEYIGEVYVRKRHWLST